MSVKKSIQFFFLSFLKYLKSIYSYLFKMLFFIVLSVLWYAINPELGTYCNFFPPVME